MEIHLINGQILSINDDAQIFEDGQTIKSIDIRNSKIHEWFESRNSIEIFDNETFVISTANILYIKR